MSNEDTVEHFGFRAAYAGKFSEWQELTSSLHKSNPKTSTGELAEQAYKTIMGSGKV
jgi:hypothetical protein|tara:strand:- start:43 stop:213 length:171 start_codon:yes stop_codon:yes gene_type:complete